MNTASADITSRAMRRSGHGTTAAAALLAPLLALAAFSAHGKCAAYINADGSSQTSHAESDCYAGIAPSRIGTGVYTVGVQYPLESEIDEETGTYTYSFNQGICTASISDNDPRASSITISPSVKPNAMFEIVPPDFNTVIVYTVRTFAAARGPTLKPADQDFTIACIDWVPYVSPKK